MRERIDFGSSCLILEVEHNSDSVCLMKQAPDINKRILKELYENTVTATCNVFIAKNGSISPLVYYRRTLSNVCFIIDEHNSYESLCENMTKIYLRKQAFYSNVTLTNFFNSRVVSLNVVRNSYENMQYALTRVDSAALKYVLDGFGKIDYGKAKFIIKNMINCEPDDYLVYNLLLVSDSSRGYSDKFFFKKLNKLLGNS